MVPWWRLGASTRWTCSTKGTSSCSSPWRVQAWKTRAWGIPFVSVTLTQCLYAVLVRGTWGVVVDFVGWGFLLVVSLVVVGLVLERRRHHVRMGGPSRAKEHSPFPVGSGGRLAFGAPPT